MKYLALLFLVSCTSVFYQPDHYLHFPPERFNLLYENRNISSQDGTRLHSWFFPAQVNGKKLKTKSKGLVLFFHGNAQNLSSHYISAVWLTRHGYDVWAWDYRGYGLSQGTPQSQGIFEDSLAALEYGHKLKEKEGYPGLIVIGQSLGGNILMRALNDDPRVNEIDLVVIDSSFLSYKQVAKDVMKTYWFLYPLSWASSLLISDEFSPKNFLQNYQSRVLVLHSKKDRVIPYGHSQEIYKLWGSKKKEIVLSDKGAHIELLAREKSDAQRKLLSILRSLPGADNSSF